MEHDKMLGLNEANGIVPVLGLAADLLTENVFIITKNYRPVQVIKMKACPNSFLNFVFFAGIWQEQVSEFSQEIETNSGEFSTAANVSRFAPSFSRIWRQWRNLDGKSTHNYDTSKSLPHIDRENSQFGPFVKLKTETTKELFVWLLFYFLCGNKMETHKSETRRSGNLRYLHKCPRCVYCKKEMKDNILTHDIKLEFKLLSHTKKSYC